MESVDFQIAECARPWEGEAPAEPFRPSACD